MPSIESEPRQGSAAILRAASDRVVCIRCGRMAYAVESDREGNVEQTQALPSAQDFVESVLQLYVELPDTPIHWHPHDRWIALELFRRQIPFAIVEAALLLGSARRRGRNPEAPALAPIRSLGYFLPIIEEVLAQPPPPSFIEYLRVCIRSL